MFSDELQRAILSVRRAMEGLNRVLNKAVSGVRRSVRYRDSGIKSVEDFFEYAFSEDPAVVAQTLKTLERQCQARLDRLRLPKKGHPLIPFLKHVEQKRALRNLEDLLEGFYPTFSEPWNPLNLYVLDFMYKHDRRGFNQIQEQLCRVLEANLEASGEVFGRFFSKTDERTLGLFQNFALLAGSLLPGEQSGSLPTRILTVASILAISDLFNYSRYLQTKEAEVAKIYALSQACEFCRPETFKSVFSFLLLKEFSTRFFSCLEFRFSYILDTHKLRAVAALFEELLIKVEDLKNHPDCATTISEVCEKLAIFLAFPEFHNVKAIVDRIQQPPSEGSN
jgi:hypothetical protein